MQFKITKPGNIVDYTNFYDNDDLMTQLKSGAILSVQVACIFEALPATINLFKGESRPYVKRVGFCKMLKAYGTEDKIAATKWAREILGWGTKDTFDLVNYCIESF